MYINRYASDLLVNNGKILGTNGSLQRIRDALAQGQIQTTVITLQESDRLDVVAGRFYGDGRLWWVIAACSGIGWWMQVPAGTRLVVPTNISQIQGLI